MVIRKDHMIPSRITTILAWVVIGTATLAQACAQTIVVGGKDFTEQLLVAEMTRQFLRAKGYTVNTRTGFSTSGIRKEQEAGLIDVYWEYTGTSLITFNNVAEKLNPQEAYARVKSLDARKGLIWLSASNVDNTYALAMRKVDATTKGINSISDLATKARRGERFRFACNIEFFIRSDGLMPLQRMYGFEFGYENVIRMGTDAVYEILRDASYIDVGLVFATDGRVAAYDFLVLRDDRGFFPSYLLAPVVRQRVLERHPDLALHFDVLSARLDNATIASLNAMIDIEKRPIGEVVSSFLKANGLI
jgi:osmoprotectant transport system substrate-binding protein